MNTTTRLMVASPRGTLTHLSRHGELTLCGRQVPATWLQEPVTDGRTVSCASCTAAAPISNRHRAPEPVEQEPAVEETPAQLPVDRAPLTLLVVPCSGAKLDTPAPARELYRGTLTTMGLAACSVIEGSAEFITGHAGTQTMILSALHGLLELDTVVAPYDVTMGGSGAITAEQLALQLVRTGATRVVALTPNRYTDALAAACELAGVQLVRAFDGCRGIGDQRGRLAQLRRSGGYGTTWGLETRRTAQAHADALAEDWARTAAAVQLVSPEFAVALATATHPEQLGSAPSARCATDDSRGRRAAHRMDARGATARMAAAVRDLPAAGTPALC
jgi:hypothetical protein